MKSSISERLKTSRMSRGVAIEGKGSNRSQPKKGEIKPKGKKARTKTWIDVLKGLKTKDEPETANSVKHFDSEEPNHLKAKTKGQRKGC